MINQRRSTVVAAAAIAVAAATSVAAVGASGQAGSQTIEVTQVDQAFKFEDVSPKGGPAKPFTQGDAFVIGGKLLKGGKTVGKDNLVCTTTQPGRKGGSLCEGTIVLSGGQITFSGYNTVADAPSTVFAVTGGTGSYSGASGTVTAKDKGNGKTGLTVQL
jgi:hypothetical protein